MRISDWSSDVCSSDLDLGAGKSTLARAWLRALGVEGPIRSPTYTLVERYPVPGGEALHLDLYRIGGAGELDFLGLADARSEEHTFELQSLMRTSYAVLCLIKYILLYTINFYQPRPSLII